MRLFDSGRHVRIDEGNNSGYSYLHEEDVNHPEEEIQTRYDKDAIPSKSILKKRVEKGPSCLSKCWAAIKAGLGRVGSSIVYGMQRIIAGVKSLCCYRTTHAQSYDGSMVHDHLTPENEPSYYKEGYPIYENVFHIEQQPHQQVDGNGGDNERAMRPLPIIPQGEIRNDM